MFEHKKCTKASSNQLSSLQHEINCAIRTRFGLKIRMYQIASLFVVHHFVLSRKKSSPKSELYCWFQSSRVWFPFLKDFFAGALANSNSKVEEKTNFQVMICTVLTLDSLNVYFHPHTRLNLWGLKMHNTIHHTNVNHYQVFVFSCCVSFFVEYEELWSSNS